MGDSVRRSWLVGAAFLLLVGMVAYFVDWGALFQRRDEPPPKDSGTGPLTGELLVAVRSPEQFRLIQEKGAAPVRAGHQMSLEVHLNEPAFVYLVWVDCRGRVVPLYPWNMDNTEVKDADQPPPLCRPARILWNPTTLGKGWQFDKGSGLETVLLLARRTPLPDDARLGALLAALPTAKLRLPEEVAVLGLDQGSKSVATLVALNRGAAEDVQKADQPLVDLMTRLQEHFELIRAVRFAHEADPASP